AREYPAYSLATMEGRFGAWRPPGGPALDDLRDVHASVLKFAAKTPRTRDEIRDHIAAHLPKSAVNDERMRNWLLWAAIATSGLIWEAAGARWEHRQLARHIAPPARLRQLPRPEAAYDLVVRRHLGAFGPATVSDIATWSSIRVPQIRAALGRLRGLRRFTDERGRELIDLAAAPRPDPDTNAPARFLARFDAAILGHAAPERTRILPAAYRKAVTLRELNRAMLARQLLLERTKLGIVAAIERLPALQAQWAPSPYYALWARLAHFTRERLWAAIESHRVIRARLMRGTLHLVSARDFYAYAVATQDLQRGAWNRVQVAKGIEPDAVAELAIAFARHPRAREDVIAHLRDRLGEVFNEDYRWLLWRCVSAHASMGSAPAGGHWGY